MTITQHLIQFLAANANKSFSTDDILAVAKDEKWVYGMFLMPFASYRRELLETLRIMESKGRITSGPNFYRPRWKISQLWLASVGQKVLSQLIDTGDGVRKRICTYQLTVD